jgi:hypothetical protein
VALNGRPVTVIIEHSDHSLTVRADLSAEDAADVVRNLEGEADITVTISPEGLDEKLMVGIDYAWAFLGLERLGGLLQYVANVNECLGTQPFTIGGQEVDMESRYVSPVAVAADVIKEWLSKGENSSFGYWERK